MTVWISRTLAYDSVFSDLLTREGYTVLGFSLINFEAVEIPQFPPCDWLFFYSKKAVAFFGQSGGFEQLSKAKIAAIGSSTAEYLLSNWGEPCDFTGTGEPTSTAEAFLSVAKNQRVVFPHARHSLRSVQEILSDNITGIDLIVYENEVKANFLRPDVDILVFTSPRNAQAYFQKYELLPHQSVVAIGQTTEKKLNSLGIQNVQIAEKPNEEGLADAVLTLPHAVHDE